MKTIFTSFIIKQSHQIVSKTKKRELVTMVAYQTLSRITIFELCESLVLWRETLSSKIVNFG